MTNRILFIIILIIASNLAFSQKSIWRVSDSISIFPVWPKDAKYPSEMEYKAIHCYNELKVVAIGNISIKYPWLRITLDGGL